MSTRFARFAAALAVFAAGTASGQTGSIAGVVTDRATGRPIEGVTIVVPGTMIGIQTKANGSYTLLGVPTGAQTIEAKRVGYETIRAQGIAVSADARRQLDFQLEVAQARTAPPSAAAAPASATTAPPRLTEWGVVGLPPGAARPASDPVTAAPRPSESRDAQFDQMLFPPELVMQHQRALELTADQRRAITEAVKALQSQTVDLQWNLQAEQQALMVLLDKRPINEQAAVAQMAKLVELEDAVKRTHLATLIKIKNALTDKQIAQLYSLRRSDGYPGRAPDPSGWFPSERREMR